MTPPPPWPPLASCCGLHPIQGDGAGLPGRQWYCTCLPPNTGQTTRPSESTLLIYISWPAGTPIAEIKQSPLSTVTTLLCFGTSGQWNHSPSSAKSSRLICSDFTSTPHSMTPSQAPSNKKNVFTSNIALQGSLINSTYNPKMRAWQLFLYFFFTLLTVICCGFALVTNVSV